MLVDISCGRNFISRPVLRPVGSELFVLLLMTILPQSFLALVGSNLMPFPFLTAGHAF
jgi:hypothetical protein